MKCLKKLRQLQVEFKVEFKPSKNEVKEDFEENVQDRKETIENFTNFELRPGKDYKN